jgi:MoaA/NifB/PqqE/SkfB family radical SAM enzyme
MIYHYNEIKTVHLEVTDSCNASCPMCARNINGGEDNPQLPNTELYLEDIKTMFSDDFIMQLDRLYMCGNYGDPIAAKDTLEIFEHFRKVNPKINLSMHTNGSAKKSEWWKNLAKVIGNHGYVVFSIDGLEDTNHLYRQNTIWSKIMENAQAFIDAGGQARWDYIVFEHNEHQVEDAKALSERMGFRKFQFKKSARFFSNASGATKDAHQASNRKGTTTLLKPPSDEKYRNSALDELSKVDKLYEPINFMPSTAKEAVIIQSKQKFNLDPDKKKPMEKLWDEAIIKCKVAEEKSLYISAEGIVQPCCWTAGQMYVWYWSPKGSQIWNAIDQIGKENLNAKNHNLESIVNGLYFQDIIPNSWNKSSCAEGKLQVCAKTCGIKNDIFANQFTN